ncbi:MAG: LLM class flavin-dependent oxidoreductase, partial [Frankiales bacterium]|nr:LLM class flavin-dependent oxidoreductase [Frankiales bacterium]
MKLGLNIGYWGLVSGKDNIELVMEAERLGFSVAWCAEAYGNDAATVLTWIAAKTEKIDVGSAIFQIPARSP